MLRRIRNGVLAGAAVFGGLMLAQAPASAGTLDATTTVATADKAAPSGYQCRYMGYWIDGDGNVTHLWDCTGG
ncbi:hypothetical protein ACFQ05_29945 [Amycolatopsis umgeniensis]|uniref:Uncharacterized protein n=1 Tax=Amycolatopsis umgeniensis TaxID=336628 RepID=A0A841BF60_9PSEU|nr:hypothetical protein [Amycolatopsis umgeniensis]MBB5857124.1 hypothetical protein [Amycolatopsis umgeniensis]